MEAVGTPGPHTTLDPPRSDLQKIVPAQSIRTPPGLSESEYKGISLCGDITQCSLFSLRQICVDIGDGCRFPLHRQVVLRFLRVPSGIIQRKPDDLKTNGNFSLWQPLFNLAERENEGDGKTFPVSLCLTGCCVLKISDGNSH